MTIPNAITFVRLALVPVMGYMLVAGEYAVALIVFLAAAVSDLLDGFIARRFGLISQFGATLDPIADKLSMFVATVLLAWQGLVPLWLAAAIVMRDVLIVGGVLAYRARIGTVEMKPTYLSKVNTFLEFTVLLIVMATAAGWLDAAAVLRFMFAVVFTTVVASGLQYIWIGSRRAAQALRR